LSEVHGPVQEQLIAAWRAQILDAATMVFAEKGFYRATAKDIARTVGIADGTIYNYFASKTDVLFGIIDCLNEAEWRQEHFALGAEPNVRSFFVAYMRHRIALIWPNAEAFRAVLPEILANSEFRGLYYQQLVRGTLEIAEHYFRAQIAQGRLRPIDVPLAVRSMAGDLLGLLILQLLGDQQLCSRSEELPELLIALIFDGLNPSRPPWFWRSLNRVSETAPARGYASGARWRPQLASLAPLATAQRLPTRAMRSRKEPGARP